MTIQEFIEQKIQECQTDDEKRALALELLKLEQSIPDMAYDLTEEDICKKSPFYSVVRQIELASSSEALDEIEVGINAILKRKSQWRETISSQKQILRLSN